MQDLFTSMLNFRDVGVKFSRFCLPLLPYTFLFFRFNYFFGGGLFYLSVRVGSHCVAQASLKLIYFREALDLN